MLTFCHSDFPLVQSFRLSPQIVDDIQHWQDIAMNNHPVNGTDISVSSTTDETSFDAAVFDTAVQHCFEKLDRLVARLHRYPLDAVTVAMGTYFQELLGALFDDGACSVDDVRAFLRDIESGILEPKAPVER